MRVFLEYRIPVKSSALAKGVHAALLPELASLPEGCSGEARLENDYVYVKFECTSISKLRALNNSFIGVVLMLLEVAGGFENE
ncbi:MAG: CTAG/PCC1 family protein [Desulfurococcaceae archaeon]